MMAAESWWPASVQSWLGREARPEPPPLPASCRELDPPCDTSMLRRIAAADDAVDRIDGRARVIADVERKLRIGPSEKTLVPELFDVVLALARRLEARRMSPAWAGRLYGAYRRETRIDRPDGQPRRTRADVEALLDAWVLCYSVDSDPCLVLAPTESGVLREYHYGAARPR
jgi:hypothetical protein